MPIGGINLHAYQTFFTHESRMLRVTRSLADGGLFDEIHIGAIWKPGLQVLEKIDRHRTVWRVPLWSASFPNTPLWKTIKFAEWELRLFLKYWHQEVSVFNAHSLIVLPLGVLFKVLKGCKLVYDTHELECEIQMGVKQRAVYKLLERLLVSFVDLTLTVCDSICSWYRNEYKLTRVNVIKNIPYKPSNPETPSKLLRDYFRISDKEIVFLYQGIFEKGRGIELILECFSELDSKKHIVFLGMGALAENIQRYASKYSNIHLHAAVHPDILASYTSSADVGITLIENTCLNYYYCLPNKIFEYLFSGLPAIVSNFPEMSKVIKDEQCGWAIPVEKQALLSLVNNLSREEVAGKKEQARRCSAKFSWDNEEKKLLRIYRGLLKSSTVYMAP